MEAILLVMEKVGILFVMIAVGFACTKAGMLTHKGIAEITAFLLRIVTPCLIVSSFLSADSGVELLVHVGLNTVELNGKYFECKVKEGDKCKAGDVLLTFDMEGIKAAGYPLVTPVIVTNSDDFVSLNVAASGPVSAGEKLLTLA